MNYVTQLTNDNNEIKIVAVQNITNINNTKITEKAASVAHKIKE